MDHGGYISARGATIVVLILTIITGSGPLCAYDFLITVFECKRAVSLTISKSSNFVVNSE